MLKYRLIMAVAILLVAFGPAQADQRSFLITASGVQDASFQSANFRVKDMSLTAWERGEGLTEVVLEYTLTRHNPAYRIFNIMLTGLSQEGKPLWAMSAKPDLRFISPNRPFRTKQTVHVPPGAFKKAVRVWMQIVDDAR